MSALTTPTTYPDYPWLASSWQTWLQLQSRLGHAYLLTGPAGIGVDVLLTKMAHSLLCQATPQQQKPCGQCPACQQLAQNYYPDLMRLQPLEGKKDLTIDQVRGLQHWLNQTAHQAGRKVVVIEQLERLNLAAFNALLKSLEEPPEQCVFLLSTHQAGRLPATIRSRCQLLKVTAPSFADAKAWLAAQQSLPPVALERALLNNWHAPLAALDWINQGFLELDTQWQADLAGLMARQKTVTNVVQSWLKWDDNFSILQAFQVQVQQALWASLEQKGPQQAWLDLAQQVLWAEKDLRSNANKTLLYENLTMAYLIACQQPTQPLSRIDFAPVPAQGFGL